MRAMQEHETEQTNGTIATVRRRTRRGKKRVVFKVLEAGGIYAQGFMQAFEQELARTRTPAYQAAKAFGKLLGKVQTWAADEQPEQPLLPAVRPPAALVPLPLLESLRLPQGRSPIPSISSSPRLIRLQRTARR